MKMLTEDDLEKMSVFFNEAVYKTKKKVKDETNPKIVNFKIRSFLEKVKDLILQFDDSPTQGLVHFEKPEHDTSQLERIEKTIA
jgi:hypothetical protein